MREVVLLSLLSAGSSLAAITDRNVFYIKPSRGSSLPSALVHNNYPADGNQRDMEFQLVEQNSLIPEIPDGPDGPGEPGLEPPSISCGYTVDGSLVENGTITSPGYPDNYPAFLDCKVSV